MAILTNNLGYSNNPSLLKHYAEKGIYFNGREMVVLPHPKGAKSMLGMDAAPTYDGFGLPSNGVPYDVLITYSKTIIDQLLNKRAYNQIGDEEQIGDFTTNSTLFGTRSLITQVSSYGDYTEDPISDANYNWVRRDAYRFQTVIQYGDLETEVMGKAKVDNIAGKRYSVAQGIAITLNKLFFFGNQTSSGSFITANFGLLNDPALQPAIAFTTQWSSDPTKVMPNINQMYGQLQQQLSNNISMDSKFYLVMSGYLSQFLATTSTLNLPIMQAIKSAYPNLEVIIAPEYTTVSGTTYTNKIQLIAPEVIMEKSVKDLFAYKYRSHGTVRQLSSYKEKVSASSFGAGIKLPAAIVTATGV